MNTLPLFVNHMSLSIWMKGNTTDSAHYAASLCLRFFPYVLTLQPTDFPERVCGNTIVDSFMIPQLKGQHI